ncbi:MAG: hypothetical protein M5U32_10545 [Myxococcota bacterium]|nr:hypothetical protein [Myxococcota bacterium]
MHGIFDAGPAAAVHERNDAVGIGLDAPGLVLDERAAPGSRPLASGVVARTAPATRR